jgi:FkbM family methyltransferase
MQTSHLVKSYSQLGQDLEVLRLYNNKHNGFFVEIGSSDGMELSNTYLLEKHYQWKGICVEPIPSKFKELCKNRPNSLCCSYAVYNESNKQVVFDICNELDLLSGISDNIDCHKKIVNKNKTQIVVNTISLNDLLDKSHSPSFIEYLSLDTEGSELEILKSVDFKKYTFGVIDVEHNYVEPRRSQIKNLLTSNGYEYVRENQFDDCYHHGSFRTHI